MPEPSSSSPEPSVSTALGADGPLVQRRLEDRFPDVDPAVVSEVIIATAEETADAKIQTFRPLLVEHRAGDHLRVHPSAPATIEKR